MQVGAHDIFDVVLIDTGNAVQKGTECVCPAAFMAAETADAQPDDAVRGLQTTQVIAMTERQAEWPHVHVSWWNWMEERMSSWSFWFKGLRISTDKVIISM